MTKLYNRRSDKQKRRNLRKNMTKAEKLLWDHIKRRQIFGSRFRRQYSVKGFVTDFYSPELKLAIEVDGGYHTKDDQVDYDKARQKIITSLGIKFLRFKNKEVLADVEKVVKKIGRASLK
jgi:very-short-patch-repair endonuclease